MVSHEIILKVIDELLSPSLELAEDEVPFDIINAFAKIENTGKLRAPSCETVWKIWFRMLEICNFLMERDHEIPDELWKSAVRICVILLVERSTPSVCVHVAAFVMSVQTIYANADDFHVGEIPGLNTYLQEHPPEDIREVDVRSLIGDVLKLV